MIVSEKTLYIQLTIVIYWNNFKLQMRKLKCKKGNNVLRIIELNEESGRSQHLLAQNFSHCSFLMHAVAQTCPLVSLDISQVLHTSIQEGPREQTEGKSNQPSANESKKNKSINTDIPLHGHIQIVNGQNTERSQRSSKCRIAPLRPLPGAFNHLPTIT